MGVLFGVVSTLATLRWGVDEEPGLNPALKGVTNGLLRADIGVPFRRAVMPRDRCELAMDVGTAAMERTTSVTGVGDIFGC